MSLRSSTLRAHPDEGMPYVPLSMLLLMVEQGRLLMALACALIAVMNELH